MAFSAQIGSLADGSARRSTSVVMPVFSRIQVSVAAAAMPGSRPAPSYGLTDQQNRGYAVVGRREGRQRTGAA